MSNGLKYAPLVDGLVSYGTAGMCSWIAIRIHKPCREHAHSYNASSIGCTFYTQSLKYKLDAVTAAVSNPMLTQHNFCAEMRQISSKPDNPRPVCNGSRQLSTL